MHCAKSTVIVLVLIATALLAGCEGIPKDGRYQTHGTGWDNFRAEAAVKASTKQSS
jgi:hypothetical protein